MAATDCNAGWEAAMRRSDFDAAWRINDAVLAGRDPETRDDPKMPYHLRWVWGGQDICGKRVLVRCYHGLGDTLQFARYLPMLTRLCASVTLEIQPELLPLFSENETYHVVPFDLAHPLPRQEVDIEIMELPHVLRLRPDHIPAAYLTSYRHLSEPVSPNHEALIGLCWQAGDWDPARSVPLQALLSHCGSEKRFLSLQRGSAADTPLSSNFINPGDRSLDIIRTAKLIQAAELVITVDTMVAHLAGALGVPIFLLLRHRADWRWGHLSESSVWYPRARLFRQQTENDWSEPLAALSRALDHPATSSDISRVAGA